MLARPRPAFGDLREQPIDIFGRDLCDLAGAPFRLNQLAQKRGPIAEAPRREIDRVLFEVAADQMGHGRRIALLDALAERIVAGVDFALEPLCFLACGGDRPSGLGADREAALAAGDAIAEKEAVLAGAKDEDAEARDLVVVNEHIAVDRRAQRLYRSLGQMLLHARH